MAVLQSLQGSCIQPLTDGRLTALKKISQDLDCWCIIGQNQHAKAL